MGAFYKYEDLNAGDNPFIVLVTKGTSPDAFTEWIMDCACKLEAAGDFLGTGMAHEGFYNALFPSKSSGEHVLPYSELFSFFCVRSFPRNYAHVVLSVINHQSALNKIV